MEEGATAVKTRRRLRRDSNPILIKELRGRMRGARAFAVLTVYLLLLSCFTSIIYYAYSASARGPGGGLEMAYLGRVVFFSIVVLQIFMVTFITPAFTAGAISGERERKTYELLRTTLLPARKLIFGKLASALTYMLLLIMAAVPLESMAFMLGGVVVEELGLALIILLVATFFSAALGLFFSAIVRTTLVSTVLAYATALLTTIGLPAVILIVAGLAIDPFLYGYGSSSAPSWAIETALIYLGLFFASLSPISTAVLTKILLDEQNALLFYWQNLNYTYSSMGGKLAPRRILVPSPWIIYTIVYIGLALVLLLLAVLRVRRQAKQ